MRQWLAICMVSFATVPCPGNAATLERHSSETMKHEPRLDFRLVDEPRYSSRPIHNSGMIASTGIAPNAAIGVGVFKSSQRKLDAGEWRHDGRGGGSRKAAVRFEFKF